MSNSQKNHHVALPPELSGLGETVIADLIRVGLLSWERRGNVPKLRMVDESLTLFLPLLRQYEVRLVPMSRPGCPVRFCTGIVRLEAGTGRADARSIPAGGQGDSAENAALGCVGELAERVSLCSLGDRDPRVLSPGMEQPQVDFLNLIGLSKAQEAALTQRLGEALPRNHDGRPDWSQVSGRRVELKSLTGDRRSETQSFAVLFQESEGSKGRALSFASSVGCAVWSSAEGARERAFLELVERDAVALTWYNRLGITFLPMGFLQEILPVALVEVLEAGTRDWGLYLLHTDLAVQVVMAVSHEPDGRRCAFGSSAGWTIASACKSALQEMLQSENALDLMEGSYPVDGGNDKIPRQLAYARTGSILKDLPLKCAEPATERGLSQVFDYETLLDSCRDRNLSVWEFNATRPDLDIPCIKLLSPDLCTWEPRFGKKRLYDSPVAWGLRTEPASEAEFAARPFPF